MIRISYYTIGRYQGVVSNANLVQRNNVGATPDKSVIADGDFSTICMEQNIVFEGRPVTHCDAATVVDTEANIATDLNSLAELHRRLPEAQQRLEKKRP